MDVVNPATGERTDTYEEHTEREVDDALSGATDAFEAWSDRPLRERERLLEAAGEGKRQANTGTALPVESDGV